MIRAHRYDFSSSDEGMNGGTVSMWVEKTISGDECPGHVAKTFDRLDSTGNWFASNPLRRNSWHKKSPTASSFGVIDSMSTSCRVSANRSMGKERNRPV